MEQQDLKFTYGEGRYKVNISAVVTTDGISITITGGEKPHVGGMALSVPRKSLAGGNLSCDTWTCPVPGHKDAEVAASTAEMICRGTGKTAAVTAGIHIDNASREDIEILVGNSSEAANMVLQQIKIILGNENAQ